MSSPRTCSHIKVNGSKCGSPALKYHTLCYFHYEWQTRRLRKEYSDHKEGWTTVTLPPLETKASIIFAICEIQASLLAGYIDNKIARTLLYAVQLAIQIKAAEDDLSGTTPATCPELESALANDRRNHLRPPMPVCDTCEKADTCASSRDCIHTLEQIREFERIHEPERYAKDRAAEEEGMRRWAIAEEQASKERAELKRTNPALYEQLHGFIDREKEALERAKKEAATPTPSTPSTCFEGARLEPGSPTSEARWGGQPCREDAEKTGASAPEVHTPNPAQTSAPASAPPATPALPREGSPARQCGETTNDPIPESRDRATPETLPPGRSTCATILRCTGA